MTRQILVVEDEPLPTVVAAIVTDLNLCGEMDGIKLARKGQPSSSIDCALVVTAGRLSARRLPTMSLS